MKYNFDEVFDRTKFGSVKWDVKKGEIPLWVADMDFACAPVIQDAILRRVSQPVYGYTVIPPAWAASYASWWKARHGLDMREDRLIFCTGVVPAISSAVRRFTEPAENVLIMTPVYNVFFNSIVNNGRTVLASPLLYDKADGTYSIDFENLEKGLALPQTTLMILCNPHNPVGRIWTREELSEIGRLCERYGVTVVSDEIHCDITRPGTEYTPFAAVSPLCAQLSVTCVSPTKAFNIAGLHTAAIYAPNDALYNRIFRAVNNDEIAETDVFACDAAISAFSEGGAEWLGEMNAYVQQNKEAASRFIKQNIPGFKVTPSDATYLIWINIEGCSAEDSQVFCGRLRAETGVFVSNGSQYGREGEHFIRVNVACPKSLLEEALERMRNFCGTQP